MPKQNDGKIFVNTLMEKELVERLDAAAKEHDRPRGWIVRLLVRKGLESMNVETKKQCVEPKK